MSYLRVPPVLEGEPDPARIARRVFGEPDWRRRVPVAPLDVGGAWQALHYLVTGDPWEGRQPEADVVCGGRLLTEDGADELGMDVIYLAPDRVKPAADHLAATPFGAVAARFDPAAMARAGVQDAARMDPAARDRVLKPAYEGVTAFFQTAADQGQAVYKLMFPTG
ncbi:YfbM family protein [Actinomadura opuntiae]|uniref:YfbM family protein n=1 Tax=Actinomadura sp. OS1-43 TaxID=604315 RepID=UPI00255B3746|nr:YfbM family protein [Actinomadura sp. OS1-43]MDL4817891.1 YfbM family protein [Actinomadura sp. OS1-43]